MTIIDAAPLFKPTHESDEPKRFVRAAWVDADLGFWVGNTEGSYVGSIEQMGRSYWARDMFGSDHGTYPSLAEAQEALEAHFSEPGVQLRVRE